MSPRALDCAVKRTWLDFLVYNGNDSCSVGSSAFPIMYWYCVMSVLNTSAAIVASGLTALVLVGTDKLEDGVAAVGGEVG